MKIGIDAMGGDNAPYEIVKGAVEALSIIESQIVLVGKEDLINKELEKYTYDKDRVFVHNADEVITNEDKPVNGIKKKKDSSMVVGFKLLKDKEIDGFISAGNTGALLAGGLLKVGRIKGIDRPAIASVYPTLKGLATMVDAGANADCKPRNLLEFGIMGSIYTKSVYGKDQPKVGIVNIGSEKGKGNALTQESYDLLEASELNFIGNVEGRELPEGVCDVIVCDGFTGNVILKLTEGVAKSFGKMLKTQITKGFFRKIGAAILSGGFKDLKKEMDYREYGGAPILGVSRPLVKAHGSSDALAIKNAVKYCEIYSKSDVIEGISEIVRPKKKDE
ncbi:MAG: phosphate acyltransferase PlsX [Firmicutes bacterium]|jgi:glycerol-3-phosphate acyltransferase PlsX|nr:phosphate acyltransferase PlsX [Bacillota bacterium]